MTNVAKASNSTWAMIAYGLLGLPLAMSALPVYVQVPTYYTTQLGLALSSAGWILFLARFIDALQDPLLGRMIDKQHRKNGQLVMWFCVAGFMLAAAFFGLWLPPVSVEYLGLWLAAMLVFAYVAHSMLNIAYLSWGARLADEQKDDNSAAPVSSRLNAAAWREAAGLIGVILASVIPSIIIAGDVRQVPSLMGWYSAVFAVLLALSIALLLRAAPIWQRSTGIVLDRRTEWNNMRANQAFKALLPPYFLNAISVSVPATLVLFFINDRLQASSYSAAFLASYFVAAAIGLPCWVKLAHRIGVITAWRWGMLLAVLAFVSAAMLGAGAIMPFFVVCIASGFALGADLALPPVLLSTVIDADAAPAAYYGIWTLLAKFALAVSGLTLPLLAYVDYHPGQPANAYLALAYAGIPCVAKLFALFLLLRLSRLLKEANHA